MKVAAALSVAFFVAACSAGQPRRDENLTAMPVPPDAYFGITWLPSDWIVVALWEEPDAPGSIFTLWRLRPDGTNFERLAVDPGRECDITSYSAPTALADGRLAALERCTVNDNAELSIVAFDIDSLERQELSALGYAPAWFAWNPTLDRGLFESGSELCQSLAWMTRDGMEPAEITVRDGDREFRLDEAFEPEGECDGGRANWPAWSPDGEEVAFMASPQSVGFTGMRRLDVPWNLYVVGVGESEARRIGDFEVRYPRGLTWSPDGAWLAFSGEVSGQGEGTWLFERETERVTNVSNRAMDWLAWSSDGVELVAIFDPDPSETPPAFELIRIDLAAALAEAASSTRNHDEARSALTSGGGPSG